jgi:hypothetical protein
MNDYYSKENQIKYMSASQFKSFQKCEASALAEIQGEIEHEMTTAMLVGSYVDAHFSSELDEFRQEHPEIFTKGGELKSDFRQAQYIIQRIERDEMFMRYISGEPQVIVEGTIGGVLFHGKLDSLHRGKAIVDLKIMKDFAPIYVEGEGRLHFIEAYGYDIQGAIYQELVGDKLPFFIAAATKEREPDLAIFSIPQQRLDYALDLVQHFARRYADIKLGLIEPERCGKCDYCKRTKILTSVTDYLEETA